MTSRGGSNLGHTLARGRGGAGRVAGTVENWWYTCSGRGGRTCGALLKMVWWLILEKPPSATDRGFSTEFGLKTRRWRFQHESEAARGVIAKGVSRRRNFVWSAWPSD
jgi:hypothetical protein